MKTLTLLSAVLICLQFFMQPVAAQKPVREVLFQGIWTWEDILTDRDIKSSDIETLKRWAYGDNIGDAPISSLSLELTERGNKLTGSYFGTGRFSDKIDEGDIAATIKGNVAQFKVESSHGGKATIRLTRRGNRLHWKVIESDGGGYWFPDEAMLRRRGKPRLRSGTVGVVYVLKENAMDFEVEIVFPSLAVEDYPIDLPENAKVDPQYKATAPVAFKGSLILFDDKGRLGAIRSPGRFVLASWCENDGGLQFRPRLKMRIRKSSLRRCLNRVDAIQGIAAFVLAQSRFSKSDLTAISSDTSELDIRLRGDLNGDGKAEATIYVSPDEAENCDGDPLNNLNVGLLTFRGQYWLRCCGP